MTGQAGSVADTARRAVRYGRVAVSAALLWTAALALALCWSAQQAAHAARQTALAAARVSLDRDRGYLHWMAEAGGIYAPVSPRVARNPRLAHRPDRDARNATGGGLTLMDPMDVTDEVNRLAGEQRAGPGLAGHIVSPETGGEHAADEWEARALEALADGRQEFSEITRSGNERRLRLVAPLFAAPACLACHATDGWQVGSVHGACSVAVPMAPYEAQVGGECLRLALMGGTVWLLGLAGIGGTTAHVHLRERERQHAAGLLAASEERFRVAAELTGELVYDHDPVHNTTEWLGAVEALTGFTAEEFRNVSNEAFAALIHEDDREQACEIYRQSVDRVEPVFAEYRLRCKDGTYRWVEDYAAWLRGPDGSPSRMLGVIQDITERRRVEDQRRQLEHQLQQAQTFESLGVLAGGIAHDFNNLLTTILGHADLALLTLSGDSPLREDLTEIEQAGRRAAELCRQMLVYAGRGGCALEPVDLNEQTERALQLLRAALAPQIELQPRLAGELPLVQGDPAQLRQAVTALLHNAAEAMGERGGSITLTTGAQTYASEALRGSQAGEELPAGRYVTLEVADTGCGMDAETLARVFEPFFTTKFTGRGLGLSATLGIVRAHHGGIWVDSEPGRGTTVRVLFPVAQPLPAAPPARQPQTATGTVLVVDDEDGVRDVARRMLEQLGFQVLPVSGGEEAVAAYREHAGAIGLVLLDLTMPRLSGEETFAALQAIDPQVRAVIASGHAEADARARFGAPGPAGYVQKPYTLECLRERVQAALGAAPPD